ncbi:hypothetical protein B0T14DRAFT_497290 [Immersiella caudata]|uniref:C2H2-type domain-containing protein n=1 Tax=Immersiella caudata TaxID=314043 RepID=A0AA39WSL7_9PEZI|nr:hypothetical protein B0T14DRAFT_497290 [Immersiella caudata]
MSSELLGIVLANRGQFGYNLDVNGWFSVCREVGTGDTASVSSSMFVEDGSSVISKEDSTLLDSARCISTPQLVEGSTLATAPILTFKDDGLLDHLLFGALYIKDTDDGISDEDMRRTELDVSDDETEPTGPMRQPSEHPKRLSIETAIPPRASNSASPHAWPGADGRNSAQPGFGVMSSPVSNYPNEMMLEAEPGARTRHPGQAHSEFASLLRETLRGSQIDPAELQLARDRDLEQNPCPSLWTGSTKDTESIAGYDVGRRLELSDQSAQGTSPTDLAQPDVRVFLVSDAEHLRFSHLYGTQAAHDADFAKATESPLKSSSPINEGANTDSFTLSDMPLSATTPPGTPKPAALTRSCQEDDQITTTTTPQPADLLVERDSGEEDMESAGDGADTDSCGGDYCSDYTPDVPYMSNDHLFMQHRGKLLEALFERFELWPQPTTRASGGQEAADVNTPSTPCREKASQSRSKRARANAKDSPANEDHEQDPKAKSAKKARLDDQSRRPRLACPFYKKAPMRHYKCHGKVISQISYLKQHLSRNHQPPLHCRRCKDLFSNEDALDAHAAEDPPCQPRTNIKYEGVTTDQKKQLERRASPLIPEERQWFDIFDILFPGYRPRPTSAYINEGLVAETENYQDFERIEGPGIIMEVLQQGGVRLEVIEDHEHDVGILRENLLAEAFSVIARRWHESRLILQAIGQSTDAGASASMVGTAPSTAGRTLVESHEGSPEGALLADEKVAGDGESEDNPDVGVDTAPIGVAIRPSTLMLQADWLQDHHLSGHRSGGSGSEEDDYMGLFDWSRNIG